MSLRHEFVLLASKPDANIRDLCQSFQISPKTGYKWLARFAEQGVSGLQDQSRRPKSSPRKSTPALETQILELNDKYPDWGSRKLRVLLTNGDHKPHPSTIDAILRRHGRTVLENVTRDDCAKHRFEHLAPNLLWQMDFKGHFPLTDRAAGRCHPLTILDDHSRFSLCLAACADETCKTVKAKLVATFQCYGLPERITADNGPPWGGPVRGGLSGLEVWLIRLGIRVSHSRPHHPQTQGKDERFHLTLKRELLNRNGFNSLDACQKAFDEWRDRYNLIRPHEALQQQTPVTRYQCSGRAFPETLPALEYDTHDHVLKVRKNGQITYKGQTIYIGEGLVGEYVAIRPTLDEEVKQVYFCHQKIREINRG